MIKTIEMYTVICDWCGKDSASDEHSGWNDKNYAEEVAKYAAFAKIGDRHYCPDCYEYDDNDEIIIKK